MSVRSASGRCFRERSISVIRWRGRPRIRPSFTRSPRALHCARAADESAFQSGLSGPGRKVCPFRGRLRAGPAEERMALIAVSMSKTASSAGTFIGAGSFRRIPARYTFARGFVTYYVTNFRGVARLGAGVAPAGIFDHHTGDGFCRRTETTGRTNRTRHRFSPPARDYPPHPAAYRNAL